jgi:hypothetical protein
VSTKVLLPRLQALRIIGASPVFKKDIDREIQPGINIVLGGNGLGKTTTMQAITFGLTGGVSQDIEPDKSFRWNHNWFSGRILEENHTGSYIELEFALGKRRLGVRRGFSSSGVLAVKPSSSSEWIDERSQAEEAFSSELALSGYNSPADFAFLVHRLLYLAEDRRLLAWDADAQARLLMLLSPESINEHEFRVQRADLKKTDSKRRHLHVSVNKLAKEFEAQTSSPASSSEKATRNTKPKIPSTTPPIETQLSTVLSDHERVTASRRKIEEEFSKLNETLTIRSNEIESLREKIDTTEALFIEGSLKKTEAEKNLPLTKLLDHGICPACGTHQEHLRESAHEHAANGQCVLCGSQEEIEIPESLAALQSQLSEKLRAQRSIDDRRRVLMARLDAVRTDEDRLSRQIAELRAALESTTPSVSTGRVPQPRSPAPLKTQLANAEREEALLLAEFQARQKRLERSYTRFRNSIAERIDLLRNLYVRYATAFLGHECTLSEVRKEDRLLSLNQFVPKFNNVVRETPESCSEAQQFFLDIAFRMAFIDLAGTLAGEAGSFFCETPENALDLSYIDNVARMFTDFATQKHALLLTANIQRDGIVQRLLKNIPARDQGKRVMNLLEIGKLSDVQKRALPDLERYSKSSQ